MSTLLIFLPVLLFFAFSLAVVAYVTFGVEKAPRFLQPLLRHVGEALDALVEEERRSQMMQQYPTIKPPAHAAQGQADVQQQPVAPAVRTRQSASDARFFELQEMAIACKFEPQIEGSELVVTGRELSRLRDYCALAFDKPLSIAEFLTPLGLKVKKVRSRR